MPMCLANQADRLSGREKKAFEEQSDQLVADAIAEGLSVREFERRCRDRVERIMGDDGVAELEKQRRNTRAWKFTDPITGMKGIHGEWDPLRGEAVHRALDAEIAARVAAGAKVDHRPATSPGRGRSLARADLREAPVAGPMRVG